MADKSIHELPVASLLTDAGLLVVYQDEKTQSIRGELIKQYAAQGVSQYVEEANTAAQTAGDAAGEAQAAAEEAKGVALYPPQVNPETGMWQTWDAAQQQYVDTDQKAEGPDGPAGSSIQSIERTSGTGAPGTTDTYTVTLTNGSTTTFQVYNGADGAGTGDFKADGSVPMTGALQMAGHTISGLPAPVSDSDPVRKQDVPTLAADRQLSNLDTPQAALVNLGAGVRPNLLDNAHFIGGGSQQGGIQFPINQSDKTQFSNSRAFDRWNIFEGELTIELDGVLIHQNLNSRFSQNINNPTRLAGETITFSMLVQAIDSGILRIAIGDSADPGNFGSGALLDTQFNAGEIKLLSVTATIQTGCSVVLSQNLSAEGMTYKCFAAKLEIGGTQTLASQKLDGEWDLLPQPENSYVTQLLTCQYYGVSFGKSLTWESVGFGEATSETSIMVVVPVPVALRIKPTATLTGTLNLRSGSQVLECTSLFVDVFGPSTVLINASVTGATPGAAYDVFVPPGSFLTLDCSL